MSRYTYTTQAQVRAAFWRYADEIQSPNITRRKIPNFAGTGTMHNTDTRCAFCDFVDHLARSGDISQALAQRVTL